MADYNLDRGVLYTVQARRESANTGPANDSAQTWVVEVILGHHNRQAKRAS